MASAGEDVDQMNAELERSGSITGAYPADPDVMGITVNTIEGTADNPDQTSGEASKTDGGFIGHPSNIFGGGRYNGTWQIGNWGDTLQLTLVEDWSGDG